MHADDLGLVSAPEPLVRPARFWTHARQVKAAPVPMPELTPEQHAAMRRELQQQLRRRPAFAPPRAPVAPPSSTVRRTCPVEDTAACPYSGVLKMFMSFGRGLSMGSAFVVGRRAVLTAGHCVYADGTWATNIQFIPRYSSGKKPHGSFTAVKSTTLREFTQLAPGPRYVYDIAACVVDRDFPDELVPAACAVNPALAPGPLRSFGYPAEGYRDFRFDGERMWTSRGDYHHEDDPGRGTTAPRVFAHFNDLTVGCSGGPIFSESDRPVVVGLNSHVLLQPNGEREEPPRMFSPYFGDAVTRLVRWLATNGGRPNVPGAGLSPPDDTVTLKAEFHGVVEKLNDLIARM